MATDQRTLNNNFATDAEFRAWGSGISAAMTAVGFLKTADTGQIDWTTVLRPAVNTDAGYEIRRLNDSMNGSLPVVVRINYGSTPTVGRGRIGLVVGQGSNGAGTITGVTATFSTSPTSSPAVDSQVLTSCGDGYFWMSAHMHSTVAGANNIFISRTTDATTGLPTAEALQILTGATASLTGSVYRAAVGWQTGANGHNTVSLNSDIHHGGTATDIAVCPFFFYKAKLHEYKGIIGYRAADIPPDATFTATHCGATRTFRTTFSSSTTTPYVIGSPPAQGTNVVGLWE